MAIVQSTSAAAGHELQHRDSVRGHSPMDSARLSPVERWRQDEMRSRLNSSESRWVARLRMAPQHHLRQFLLVLA